MDLWELALDRKDLLRFSTLLTAQDVRDHLSTPEGLDAAVAWCRATAVTRVFIESFRDGYTAEKAALERIRDCFIAEGFDVAGCITPTRMGKTSTGYKSVSCYTDAGTLSELQGHFEYAAGLFDLVMVDDFLFTDCECDGCAAARGDRPWAEFRCDLMMEVSADRILGPARAVNPDVQVIIKYPQWYDQFHPRGYDVARQTDAYEWIWVGTEVRNFDDPRWGGCAAYRAFWLMRWLDAIGGPKTGGGWFDPYGTTPLTYLEQARQTVLGGAKDALLFCYGSLLKDTGPENILALQEEIPGLFELADTIRGRAPRGIHSPKPPNSDADDERYVYDFVGMLGLPLAPATTFDPDAASAFLPVQALADPALVDGVTTAVERGTPLLVTEGLSDHLPDAVLQSSNVLRLDVGDRPRSLLEMPEETLQVLRSRMLAPLGIDLDAPPKVALYLFGDDRIVLENFRDEPAAVRLRTATPTDLLMRLPAEAAHDVIMSGDSVQLTIPARGLVVLGTGADAES